MLVISCLEVLLVSSVWDRFSFLHWTVLLLCWFLYVAVALIILAFVHTLVSFEIFSYE